MLGVATARLDAQGSGSWEPRYYWFSGNSTTCCEIAHAAMIGKPGPRQGKVVLWRTVQNFGRWIFDPASPQTVISADSPGPADNVFCAGQSWDVDGDLVLAGGERNGPRCTDDVPSQFNAAIYTPEPNWTYLYEPSTSTWARKSDLMFMPPPPGSAPGHYYTSTVVLPDGRVLAVGGGSAPWNPGPPCNPPRPFAHVGSNWMQVYDKPNGVWSGMPGNLPLPGLPITASNNIRGFQYYPLTHLLSTGHVFVSSAVGGGQSNQLFSPSAVLDVSAWPPVNLPGTNSPWVVHPSRLQNAAGMDVNLLYPTSIQWPMKVGAGGQLMASDQVVVFGGTDLNDPYNAGIPVGSGPGRPAQSLVWNITSPEQTTSTWRRPNDVGGLPALPGARVYANSVILPTMQLVVFGGSMNHFAPFKTVLGGEVPAQPVYAPVALDLLNPTSWTSWAPHVSARLYHSVAVLLSDGRVLVAGGYNQTVNLNPPLDHSSAEIFSPPYMQYSFDRPTILTAPSTASYGASISLTVNLNVEEFPPNWLGPASEIEFGFLVRCAAVTHHFDWDQKSVTLEVQSASNGSLVLVPIPAAPQGPRVLPPGYYMLFVVRRANGGLPGSPPMRVPSMAKFIHIA